MNDLIIDFHNSMVSITAKTPKGLKYLKSHWRKRPLISNMKLVKRWKITLLKKAKIKWAILSNCKDMCWKKEEMRNEFTRIEK